MSQHHTFYAVVQHKKRLMRKDYQGDGKRDNAWNEKKTHRADQYLEAGDMHNEPFEEYYKVQVGLLGLDTGVLRFSFAA